MTTLQVEDDLEVMRRGSTRARSRSEDSADTSSRRGNPMQYFAPRVPRLANLLAANNHGHGSSVLSFGLARSLAHDDFDELEEASLGDSSDPARAVDARAALARRVRQLFAPDERLTGPPTLKMSESQKARDEPRILAALAARRAPTTPARRRWALLRNVVRIVAFFGKVAARLELYLDSEDEAERVRDECEVISRADTHAQLLRQRNRRRARERRLLDLDGSESSRRKLIANKAWFVVNPQAPLKIAFDFGTVMLIIAIIIYVPYQIAFIHHLEVLPPIEIFILCYFSVDLVLGFFTAYEDAVREVFVFDHRKIVWHYLSTFFIVDLISTIPFELMVDTRRGTQVARFTRFIKILKLAKLAKSGQLGHSVQWATSRTGLPPAFFEAAWLLFVFMVICHVFACGWALLGRETSSRVGDVECFLGEPGDDPNDPWFPIRKCTWYQIGGLSFRHSGDTNGYLYTTCLYFTITTLSTVGYGDYSPNTLVEKVYGMIVQIVGVALYAFIISFISGLLADLDSARRDRKLREDELALFAHKHNLSYALVTAMRAHQRRYLHAAHLWRADETRRNVDHLPPSLKVAVVLHLEKGLLSRLPFVHGTPRPFAAALVSVLVPLLANIDEVVVARGEVADALFFVVQGGVSVLASSHASAHHLGEIPEGAHFGDEGVLLGAKWTAELRAARPAELQAVQGHKLLALLDDFPTVRTRLLETALRRVAGAPILEVPAKPPRPKTPKKPRARGLLRTIGT
mmetsp:Transcript_18777/g.58651  ORF Transcript_18777/g.58651 Transcript_18777/m.58651 type:complete len:747 (+) Transcript_18777:211-2451(+)